MPLYFGIRHLSPAGAKHVLETLKKYKPALVLIEGPSDLTGLMDDICHKKAVPPIAMMAYSETVPIESILYPFAEYSPEYQAILWAKKQNIPCRFIDLPSSVFLAISKRKRIESNTADIYQKIAEQSGEKDQEIYWERNFEHRTDAVSYQQCANIFGKELRELSVDDTYETAENILREAYMKKQIDNAMQEGFSEDKIIVITGAYHVEGIKNCEPLTEKEIKALPKIPAQHTLMPYSYYRLSSRSGYGAGNKAPAYYELLWKAMKKNNLIEASYQYLSSISSFQRKTGNMSSSAEVIEAVRLAITLANMKKSNIPTLQDLRDAAITCLGHGSFSEIAKAVASTEIGTKIGALPEGVSRTSIQSDFYYKLKDLKLERYKGLEAQILELDLRENTRVKSQKSAFLDLERSFFLHRICVLGIHFAQKQKSYQEKATWAEKWLLQWTPEAEIEIVEAALQGETVEVAVAFSFKEKLEKATSIIETAEILENASLCGMPQVVQNATIVLQGLFVEESSVIDIANTIHKLSAVIRYGNIRCVDANALLPILEQLFYRACLLLEKSCICDNHAVEGIITAMDFLNLASINHDTLAIKQWVDALLNVSNRDDLNTKASGFAAAILLERGEMTQQMLLEEMKRRLSYGIPADLGAGWFEGLALKNKYALISRFSLWEQLSEYIDTLNEEEFKKALVFLRRAFCYFTASERNNIAENLGEIWQFNTQQVSAILNDTLTEIEQDTLQQLDEFDFGDI